MPVPVTLTDQNGITQAISGATTTGEVGGPTPIVITDQNGDLLALTGSVVGVKIGTPIPVVLTDSKGYQYNSTVTLTSGGQVNVAAPPGTSFDSDPLAVCLCDANGNPLTGLTSSSTFIAAPILVVLCDTNGNAIALTISSGPTDGVLLEDGTSFLLLEDGTSYLLQEV